MAFDSSSKCSMFSSFFLAADRRCDGRGRAGQTGHHGLGTWQRQGNDGVASWRRGLDRWRSCELLGLLTVRDRLGMAAWVLIPSWACRGRGGDGDG
ncbi:hypothetical protein M0R45_019697 [Rubus argutus]|uniref:Uncharacterized protein n=1 Tax=Rubus argutus TaxID=59490 RepID=A0AAW1X8K8_RUBAR